MSYENKRNIPPCNNKPGGLVKLFVSKVVPRRFAESFANGVDKSSFQHIDDYFFMVFYKKVHRAYDVYLKAKDANYLLGESDPYTGSKGDTTANYKPASAYNNNLKRNGKNTLTGRLNALSARNENSDTEDSDKGRKTGMLQYEDERSEDRGNELEEGTAVVRSFEVLC